MKICLDPGHGGSDPGAVAGEVKEKDIALKIAHRTAWLLINYYDVIATRWSDEDVELADRVNFANAMGSDVFISIHCNSFTDPGPRGLEVYCYKPDPATKGYNLARKIYGKILNVAELEGYHYTARGIKQGDWLYVIRKTVMPAVLVEVGFVSNPDELAWLNSPKGHIAIGYAIAQAVIDYVG